MEEEKLTGRESGAARDEISWATRNMICEEGVPVLANSACRWGTIDKAQGEKDINQWGPT